MILMLYDDIIVNIDYRWLCPIWREFVITIGISDPAAFRYIATVTAKILHLLEMGEYFRFGFKEKLSKF